MRSIDISRPLSPSTPVYPGDEPLSLRWTDRTDGLGGGCNTSALSLSAHLGTHVDAPRHVDDRGADLASLALEIFVGPCRVIDARGGLAGGLVAPAALEGIAGIAGAERVLLKTGAPAEPAVFEPGYAAISEAAARVLVAAGVRLVGIDTPSVDPFESAGLPAHRVLLGAGVALLENVDLTGIAPGEYELIALPLRLVDGDASPVRALLRG